MKEELIELAKQKKYYSFHTINKYIGKGWYIELCLLQKWLREKHEIHIWVECPYDFADESIDLDTYNCTITKGLFSNTTETEFCNSYEEALEQGLFEGLKLIK